MFLENYDKLFKKFGSVYLAIKSERIIGVYSSYIEGVNKTLETEKLGTFIIQYCNGNVNAFTNYIA